MPSPELVKSQVKALVFDTFGTVVDWRSSVTDELVALASKKAASSPSSAAALEGISKEDWGIFAQEWRNSYKVFVRSFVPGTTPWKDIDTQYVVPWSARCLCPQTR